MSENNTVTLSIDGKEVKVKKGSTILDAARKLDIDIPTLCFLKDINEVGACRMCLVEVEGARGYLAACVAPAENGMVVKTNTPKLIETKKTVLELILSAHEKKCLICVRNQNCELQKLAEKFGVDELPFEGVYPEKCFDNSSSCIVRNTAKCILCKRCVNVCKKVQKVSAIGTMNRGFKSKVGVALDMSIKDSTCVGCGQCVINCPVGALSEKSNVKELEEVLRDHTKHIVIQTAPATRATIGEEFGEKIGTLITGKMVAGLKKLGFDKVFDTDVGADVTIMEEATELISRLTTGGKLPMITSCSSGWITYAEKFYPEILDHLSTTKSPMEILGTIIKTYYAKKMKIDPKDIYSVALMPCSAKKAEIEREHLLLEGGIKPVDNVVTVREMARLLKKNNIDISKLEDVEFDSPLGEATGAAHIFGTTGGVMEAALRTAAVMLKEPALSKVTFKPTKENPNIREATVKIGGKDINIAIAQTLKAASEIMDEIAEGDSKYSFIEVMTCPGGCVNGGGQPIIPESVKAKTDYIKLRANALYKADRIEKLRVSIDNPDVQKLYKDFFGKPNSEKAEKLLHTHYTKQDCYVKE